MQLCCGSLRQIRMLRLRYQPSYQIPLQLLLRFWSFLDCSWYRSCCLWQASLQAYHLYCWYTCLQYRSLTVHLFIVLHKKLTSMGCLGCLQFISRARMPCGLTLGQALQTWSCCACWLGWFLFGHGALQFLYVQTRRPQTHPLLVLEHWTSSHCRYSLNFLVQSCRYHCYCHRWFIRFHQRNLTLRWRLSQWNATDWHD